LRQVLRGESAAPPARGRWLSVVIPTLNEATEIEATIARARAVPEVLETIVADGGGDDDTVRLAEAAGARVIRAPRGRGGQLAAGAGSASGEVVLLLHADTWLPSNAGAAICRSLSNPAVVGGAFYKLMRNPPFLTRGARFRCWLRMAIFQFAYGDQALFVRRTVLEAAGGVPKVPLMEEYLLCEALQRFGRLALAPAVVSTSSRRFRESGVLRTYWRMWTINARWAFGARPDVLREYYERR
jgi:rSAM/selenodomain-associated transferase 2